MNEPTMPAETPTELPAPTPIFEMDATTRVHTFWWAGDGKTFDFLGGVYTESGTGQWIAKWRFRHYAMIDGETGDAFGGDDQKNVFAMRPKVAPGDPEQVVAAMELVAQEVFEKLGIPITRMPINGGREEFTKVLLKQPFANVKVAAKEPERSM